MSEDMRRLFDEAAAGYDRARGRLVPDSGEFYGAVVGLIPKGREESFRVLDLGAGTGLLGDFVGRAFPKARITLADFSEEMMSVAKGRFSDDPEGRFEFHLMDYAREPLPGEYEIVMSSLSIHHLEDADKKRVFRKIHDALVDGGVFINAEQVHGETPEVEHEHHEAWLRQARAKGASEEEVSAALRRMKTDKTATLENQLAWMGEAGFASVECRYENGRFAVYSGRKP